MKKRNFGVSGAALAMAAFVAGLAGMVSPAQAQTKVVVDPGKKYQVFETLPWRLLRHTSR